MGIMTSRSDIHELCSVFVMVVVAVKGIVVAHYQSRTAPTLKLAAFSTLVVVDMLHYQRAAAPYEESRRTCCEDLLWL